MDIQLVKSALSYIPSHERDVWLKMGMAIKSEYGETGFEIWDEWSRTSHNYKLSDSKSVWRSIDGVGGITIGTLIYEAKRHGFDVTKLKQGFSKGKVVLRISDNKLVEKGLSVVTNSVPAMEQPLPLGFINRNENGPKYINLLPGSVYSYKNYDGQLLGYVYRYEPETLQRADKGANRKAQVPVTYFSDGNWYAKALPAYPFYGSEQINGYNGGYLIHEGEKCADLANKAFPLITSLATQGGSNGLGKNGERLLLEEKTISALKNGKVYILPDKDNTGAHYAEHLKLLLGSKSITVTVLSISFIEQRLGTTLAAGSDVEQLIAVGLNQELLNEWISYPNNNQDCLTKESQVGSGSNDNKSDNLTVREMVNLFIDFVLASITEAHRDISNNDIHIKLRQEDEFLMTHSSLFQEWILDSFHKQYKRICKESKEIAKIITSRAKLIAKPFQKISRIVFDKENNELTINIGNDRLVNVSKNGVSFSEYKALPFQYESASNHIPYEYCEESATLDEVRAFFGVSDFDLLKVLAHIAISYLETEHKALLNLYGPKGVGKSTLAKKIMSVANPSNSINTFPSRRNDFCEIAHKGGMLTFDNLSKIDKGISDLMATTITGSEEEVRKHFKQNQTIKYILFNSITITSIDNCVTESDLNDRSFIIHLLERQDFSNNFSIPSLGKVVHFIFNMLSKMLALKEQGSFINNSRQNRKNSWLKLAAHAVGIDFSSYEEKEHRENIESEVSGIHEDIVAVSILDKLATSNGVIEGYVSDVYRDLHSVKICNLYYTQNHELAKVGIREFCKRVRNINFKLIGIQVYGPVRRQIKDRRGEYVKFSWLNDEPKEATVTHISHYKENKNSQKFQQAVELVINKLGLNNDNDKEEIIRTSIASAVCGIDSDSIVNVFSMINLTEQEKIIYRNPIKLYELIRNGGVK